MSGRRLGPSAVVAALATVLFGSFALLSPPEREEIRITPEMNAALVENQEALLGRPLNPDERQQVVDMFVEEEILVREAYRRGLDIGDRRVRPVLVAAGQSAIVDPESFDDSDPTTAEIGRYYEENRESYETRETIGVESVSFLVGTLAEDQEAEVMEALRAGQDPRAVGGGVGRFQARSNVSRSDISRSVGREFAAQVFDLDAGGWEGPFRTTQAIFFVRLLDRTPSRARDLEEVEHIVRQEIIAERQRAAVQEALEEVRTRYHVVIESAGTP